MENLEDTPTKTAPRKITHKNKSLAQEIIELVISPTILAIAFGILLSSGTVSVEN